MTWPHGGKGHAKGGDGGDADTGNKQAGNGNSLAVSVGGKPERIACGKCGRHESKTRSEGGDTYAKSGDAYGRTRRRRRCPRWRRRRLAIASRAARARLPRWQARVLDRAG